MEKKLVIEYDKNSFKALIKKDDFDCLPVEYQVKSFVEFLRQSGVKNIETQHIKYLYSQAQLKSPTTGNVVRVKNSTIKRYLDRYK